MELIWDGFRIALFLFLGDIMVFVMQKNAFIFRRYLLKYLRIKGKKTEIYIEKF